MGCWETRVTVYPWHIEQSDLCEANDGDIELSRDLVVDGKPERHIGLHVVGQFNPSLGLVVIRCGRHGGKLIPLTLSIPETPIVVDMQKEAE